MQPHNTGKKAASRLNGKRMYVSSVWNNVRGFMVITGLSVMCYAYNAIPTPELINPLVAIHKVEAIEVGKIVPITPQPTQTVKTNKKPVLATQNEVLNIIDEVWGDDAAIGRQIAFCESSWGLSLTNSQSSATGVFQIIKATWISNRKAMGADTNLDLRFDHTENIKTAHYLFKRQGVRPWEASRGCWGK